MSGEVEDMDGSFRWAKECPGRYEITLYFSDGGSYTLPKTVKEIICTYAEIKRITLEDYIWTKPKELKELIFIHTNNNQTLDSLVDVKVSDKNDYMENTLQRLVDRSVNKYLNKKTRNSSATQTRLPESQGHIQIKNEIVQYLKQIGVETYPEVVFYENARYDFYDWQKQELRNKSDADGIFGYGNVGFGHYKQEYGQQIRVDVAGWIDNSYGKFEYPVVAVEVMKSSKLQEEIIGLNKIHGSNAVYAIVVDAFGKMGGQINGIPVVSLATFKNCIADRIEMVKNAIKEGKKHNEIFDIGMKFNTCKLD